MKNMQQNSKTLDKYIAKLHDQLRMRLKFHTNKLDEVELNKMVCQIINIQQDHHSSHNKQNVNINSASTYSNDNGNGNDGDKIRQIDYLRRQIEVESKLIRKFYNQMKKQHLTDISSVDRSKVNLSSQQSTNINSIISSFNLSSNYNHQTNTNNHLNASINIADSQSLDSPQRNQQNQMIRSVEVKNSINKESGRSPKIMASLATNQIRQSTMKQVEQSRSKTFAKLRKLEAMFCNKNQKNNNNRIRRQSFAPEFHEINSKQNQIISQENLNLKAIRNNLVTHLSIMQKYKGVASIEELVHQEQQLKKRESKVRELQEYLQNKERKVNKTYTQVLRRQRSTKIL